MGAGPDLTPLAAQDGLLDEGHVLDREAHGQVDGPELEAGDQAVPVRVEGGPDLGGQGLYSLAGSPEALPFGPERQPGLLGRLEGFEGRHRSTSDSTLGVGRMSTGMPNSIDASSRPSGS